MLQANGKAAASKARLNEIERGSWDASWTPAKIPDLRGKVALVTGANSGMGWETTRKLAENGAKVYMVSKDRLKGEEAARRIREEIGKPAQLEVLQCDFTSLRNVVGLAEEYKRLEGERLDLLVNMAGIFYGPPGQKTPDGFEPTLQTNFWAHSLLTLSLLDQLRATPEARIVFMASGLALLGQLDWNHLTGDNYIDSGLIPYANSKRYIIMFARELANRVPDLDVFAVQPGLVDTPLHQKSSFSYPLNWVFKAAAALPFIGLTPYRGSWPALYAATEPSLTGKHFAFFGPQLLPFLNTFPTTDRTSTYVSGATGDRRNTERLFDTAQDLLQQKLGSMAPPKLGYNTPAPAKKLEAVRMR